MGTGIFIHDLWGRFLSFHPVFVVSLTALFVSGIMLFFNLIDVLLIRGQFNRGAGYFTWWTIIFFNNLSAPLFSYYAFKFAKATIGYESSQAATDPKLGIMAALLTAGSVLFFLWTAHDPDWTKGPGNNFGSFNIVGWYHFFMFVMLAYFIFDVLIRGGWLLLKEYPTLPPEITSAYWNVIIILVAIFVLPQIADIFFRMGIAPTPNDIIGKLIGIKLHF